MRHLRWPAAIGLVFSVVATACVTPPPAGVTAPATVAVLPADARALRYGPSAPAVFDNPEMRDKVRALFGSDWAPAAQGGGRLQYGAAAYFPADSRFRMLRMDGQEYIAISGCVPGACATHGGLLLISADGDQVLARLDEGGFSRYYGHGAGMTSASVSPAFIDSAWRAIDSVERSAATGPARRSA